MRYFQILILLLAFSKLYSQNLIPNPSFENLELYPCNSQLCNTGNGCCFEYYCYPWKSNSLNGSPDVYTTKSKNWNKLTDISIKKILPHDGNVIIGTSLGGEHFSVRLNEKLKVGTTYYLEFHIKSSRTYSDALGILFSNKPVKQKNETFSKPIFDCYPTFKVKNPINAKEWTKLSLQFEAKNESEFLTIGLFAKGGIYTHQTFYSEDDLYIEDDKSDYSLAGYYFFDSFILKEANTDSVQETEWLDYRISNLKEDIFFSSSNSELTQKGKLKLERFANKLNQLSTIGKIHIKGYADNIGKSSSNEILSKKRALVVQNELYNYNIEKNKIIIEYYGESKNIGIADSLYRKVEVFFQLD
ncbi:OmpA family protein [Chondrinema litorale]|uniref:OmpA family protein n=1 Tax=Chondrinema litorale TaxID=2994555 RepID=UPI00254286AF|nr:OmpA family protein [Chondrinema litorale]UZR98558.1 OmpA family protein [Chondrinema litorale]